MEQTKISIIVPIYNASKYLEETLKSIINQTYRDIEIICVNDGSKDDSLEIIKDFMVKDDRIKLIDKKNEGVWKARIDGINQAQGKYISFIDADDYISQYFIEKLYENICKNESDIAICGFNRIDGKTGKVLSNEMRYKEDRVIKKDENFEEIISINTALWNKLYKADLLKNMITFKNYPRILEDMMFLAIVYLNVQKISFVDDYLYKYMVRDGSAMNTLKKEEIENIQNAMLEVKEHYIKNNCSQEQLEILSSMAFLHFGISLMIKASGKNNCNFREEYKRNLIYLNTNFPEWKKTKYLNLIYSLKHKKSNFKLVIIKKIYRLHLFKIFVHFYNFIINTLKIELKW